MAPKRMNGNHTESVDVLTPEEMRAFRAELVQSVVTSVNNIFNKDGRPNVGVAIMLWDIGKENGRVSYSSNQPREMTLQVMQKFRERSEKPQEAKPIEPDDAEPEAQQ